MNIRDGVQTMAVGLTAVLVAALVACGSGSSSPSNAPGGAAAVALSGTVQGGQQPVNGAQVTAYVAGNGTTNGTPVACVTTDANGGFAFGSATTSAACTGGTLPKFFACSPATATCAPTSQIYLVAAGGNPGLTSGTNNTALVLMAALGPFNAIPTSHVNLSELTTVGAVYSLAQTMGVVNNGSGLAARLAQDRLITGKSPHLDNGFARAKTLVDVTTSLAGTALPAAATCTGDSQPLNCAAEAKLNTLANALAACVNTTAPTSTACVKLFCVATPKATFSSGTCTAPAGGAIPTDTLQSALSIVLNAGTVPAAGVFSLPAATPQFSPGLGAAPGDWALALNIDGGAISGPAGVAIDANDNVWIGNTSGGSVTELTSTGTVLSGANGFTGGGAFGKPGPIAIDSSGNAWVADALNNTVSKLNTSGMKTATVTGGGLNGPLGIAIDSGGNVWIASNGNGDGKGAVVGAVTELSSSAALLSGSSGFTAIGGMNAPDGIAVDGGDGIWVANNGNGSTVNNKTGSITNLTNVGAAISPAPGGFTGGGLNQPAGIAVDASGNVWAANLKGGSISEFSHTGTPVSPAGGYAVGGINVFSGPVGVAIDGGGNVWVINAATGAVSELNGTGAPLSPSNGFTGGGLGLLSAAIAIDAIGNVWVTNFNSDSVTELLGAAVPKKTPAIGPPVAP